MTDDAQALDVTPFNEREMDKTIRQIVDKVRRNYFENGDTARGIPSEIKKVIESNMDHI